MKRLVVQFKECSTERLTDEEVCRRMNAFTTYFNEYVDSVLDSQGRELLQEMADLITGIFEARNEMTRRLGE